MKTDLFGNLIHESEDFLPILKVLLEEQEYCMIKHNSNTKKGFFKSIDLNLSIRGLYVIYKMEVPVYIGLALGEKLTIHNRIGRWFSVIYGTNRFDESHPGAIKYFKIFGTCCDGLTVKAIDLSVMDNILKGSCVKPEELEKLLIRDLNPICNVQGKGSKPITSQQNKKLYMPGWYNHYTTFNNF